MSTFRPPQVPQQPVIYYTPGQPSGVPAPRIDYQGAAYFRPPPAPPQPQFFAPVLPPPARVPPLAAQGAAYTPARGAEIGVMIEQLMIENTSGKPLGAPIPVYDYQRAAYWQARQVTAEFLSQQLQDEFTPGTSLGVPRPLQTDQVQATWRMRIEIQQPQIFQPRLNPTVFVPPVPLQIPLPALRQQLEAQQEAAVPLTAGLSLGVPVPKQSEQAAAYVRARLEPTQTPATTIQSGAVVNVPPMALQVPAEARTRYEWFVPLPYGPILAPNLYVPQQSLQQPAQVRTDLPGQARVAATAGLPLGIPQPRQSDQVAAYWRARIETQQPVYFPVYGAAIALISNPCKMVTLQARAFTCRLNGRPFTVTWKC